MADLATIVQVEAAWRPLSGDKRTRAEHYLGVVSRRIRRRWPDVDTRIAAGTLNSGDVADVVVDLVLSVIGGPPVRGARSWNESAGSMSRAVTLEAGTSSDPLAFEHWMLEIFGAVESAKPVFHSPPSGRYDRMFQWSEEIL